jgi:hypothetical protein
MQCHNKVNDLGSQNSDPKYAHPSILYLNHIMES